jgi:hypothetical protein
MRTISPGSSSATVRRSPYDDLDAVLRGMGIKPNRRRRAALLSWNQRTVLFGSGEYGSGLSSTVPERQARGQ